MDETPDQKGEKCQLCYRLRGCMLTTVMSELCGGPWKDEDERDGFIRKQILGIKKK